MWNVFVCTIYIFCFMAPALLNELSHVAKRNTKYLDVMANTNCIHLSICRLKWHTLNRHIRPLTWSEGAKSENKTHATCLCLSRSIFIWPDLNLLSLIMEIVLQTYFLHRVLVEAKDMAFIPYNCLLHILDIIFIMLLTQIGWMYSIELEFSLGK